MGVLAVVFGYGLWDNSVKRAQLEEVSKIQSARHTADLDEASFDRIELLTCEKAFYFFGTDIGVLRIYVREAGDTMMNSFVGIEYFYNYGDEGWQLSDTAQIKQPEYIFEGYKIFEDHGFDVDPKAYERYNR